MSSRFYATGCAKPNSLSGRNSPPIRIKHNVSFFIAPVAFSLYECCALLQYICFFETGSEDLISYCLSHNLPSWLSTKLGNIRYFDTVFLRILLLPHCFYGLPGRRDFASQAINTKSENKGTGLKLRIPGRRQVISVCFPSGCVRGRFRWVACRYAA